MTMKPALLHGYIICDSDGGCQAHTLATNRRDCWERLIVGEKYINEDLYIKRRAELKRQGFRAARVWVKDAEIKL